MMSGLDVQVVDIEGVQIAEMLGQPGALNSLEGVHELIGEVAFNLRVNRVLAYLELIDARFFDLKTGFLGELTQKFTNYRLQLAIVGSLGLIESLALKAYLHESKLSKTVRYFKDRQAAIAWLVAE